MPTAPSAPGAVDAFLRAAGRVARLADVKGRLIFAIDATMSRQPTWDRASEIQGDMFEVARDVGGLGVQLVYFRGRGEFEASPWTANAAALGERMRTIRCRSGFTQVRRVLAHAVDEARLTNVKVLVLIGDCFEENEHAVFDTARALALCGVKAFLFHEGDDPDAGKVFREIARLTRGVYARFDRGAVERLRELLRAAAVYATGGAPALLDHGRRVGGETLKLARQLDGGS